MAFCSNCGMDVGSNNFCPNCGASQRPVTQKAPDSNLLDQIKMKRNLLLILLSVVIPFSIINIFIFDVYITTFFWFGVIGVGVLFIVLLWIFISSPDQQNLTLLTLVFYLFDISWIFTFFLEILLYGSISGLLNLFLCVVASIIMYLSISDGKGLLSS